MIPADREEQEGPVVERLRVQGGGQARQGLPQHVTKYTTTII